MTICFESKNASQLKPIPPNATGKGHVLGHDGNTLRMNCALVGVLEKTDQKCFWCLLKGTYSRGLEANVRLKATRDLPDQSREGQFANQEVRWLLESSNLTERDDSWSKAMRFLNSARTGAGFAGYTSLLLRGNLLVTHVDSPVTKNALASSTHHMKNIRREIILEEI